VAALQDLLVYALKGLGMYAHRCRKLGVKDAEVDGFVLEALFTTLTNVNFAAERFEALLGEAARLRDRLKRRYLEACQKTSCAPEELGGPATWVPAEGLDGLVRQGEEVSILKRREALGDDVAGLQELLTYGLKGLAAYAYHARKLGWTDDTVLGFLYEALDFLAREVQDVEALVAMSLKCGEANLKTMRLLDEAHTSTYGHPEPTAVRIEPVAGPAIVVSGHDLKDLEALLEATVGEGVNVYTHGEMLPAHAYPGLKRYKHLVGNYGGAWQEQRREFEAFPGAILMTTNCLMPPKESYKKRLFTCGPVGFSGVAHIEEGNFSPLVEAAKAAGGFAESGAERTITVGFARQAVLSVADKVVEAVRRGAIRHFFLIGGCDGAKAGRNYYAELAQAVPADCLILTLACGKYRFNKLDFGSIDGIPRLLDVGQCNDAYSAIQIALALAQAFNTDVNSLPLSLVISWYEQKAVAILLTLLHLGIKNIRLGPSLPAFITPVVLKALVEKFNLTPIENPAEDLQAMLG